MNYLGKVINESLQFLYFFEILSLSTFKFIGIIIFVYPAKKKYELEKLNQEKID